MLMSISKKIEFAANVAIIVVAVLLAVVLVKNYLVKEPNVTAGPGNTQTKQETKLTSLDLDWKKNGQTLLLVISTGCHFCTDSAPFYKQITKQHQGTRLVAVLPQTLEDSKQYLDALGVIVDEIKQVSLDTINVRGTPTLMLVDSDGVVTDSWIGKLPDKQQNEVLNRLAGAVAGK
jgi:Tfp pilus assembly major pilin PilA